MNLEELDKAMDAALPLGYRKTCSACRNNTCRGHDEDIIGSGISLPRTPLSPASLIIKFPASKED